MLPVASPVGSDETVISVQRAELWHVCSSLMFHLKCVASNSSVILYGVQSNGAKHMYLTIWLDSACSKVIKNSSNSGFFLFLFLPVFNNKHIWRLFHRAHSKTVIKALGFDLDFFRHIQKYKYYSCNPTSCCSSVEGAFRATRRIMTYLWNGEMSPSEGTLIRAALELCE